jgi:hypothetical protein
VWVFRKRIGDYPGTLRIRFADDRGSLSGTDDTAEVKKGRPCAPTLKLEMFPAWEEFIATVPDIVHSCRIHDLGVLRATPGRYYWIWAWDMLVSVHEAMRWGDVGLCRDTIRFVNEHRDANGRIPARWTRSLLPLDTPSPGGIEFLFAAVTHLVVHETGDRALLADVFPAMVASLRAVAPSLKAEGMVRGEGFYPDLLTSFGRKPESAVSMETGSWFVYCVIMEDLASLLDDRAVAEEARVCKKSVAAQFLARFEDKDFLVDAIDPETGKNNGKHPLFSMLFLHTTEGFELVGSKIGEMADAIEQRFLSEHGMRIMPIGEGEGEVVLDSWYPHWDLYAIRVLRRAGRRDAIMKWLKLSERVLSTLGYCPEFLEQSGFRTGDPGAWERHGAASNLNCVTGWYRALREAVFGIEITGSYITHFPLSLPLGTAVLEGIRWKEGEWRFTIDYSGPHLKAIIVDGEEIQGLVIPGAHGTPGQHHVTIRYGDN